MIYQSLSIDPHFALPLCFRGSSSVVMHFYWVSHLDAFNSCEVRFRRSTLYLYYLLHRREGGLGAQRKEKREGLVGLGGSGGEVGEDAPIFYFP